MSSTSLKKQLYIARMMTGLSGMTIYDALQLGENCIFLDSSKEDSPYSQYSLIGANPFLILTYKNHQLRIDTQLNTYPLVQESDDIFSYLNRLIEAYRIDNPTSLPFIGGGLGYLSYDLCHELENFTQTSESILDIPDGYFVFYDNALILDHAKQELTITGLGLLEAAQTSVQDIINVLRPQTADADSDTASDLDLDLDLDLDADSDADVDVDVVADSDADVDVVADSDAENTLHSSLSIEDLSKQLALSSPFTKDSYMEAVESMRQYIEEGHIYIANMTHTFTGPYHKSPAATYHKLRSINPAPFSAYMPLNGFHVLSSSPERFLDIRKGMVETRPIKGTIPRGKTPEEDRRNMELLQSSEKDKSELLMIVDLERNDLSRVCKPGSVKVTELFKTEKYATVYHLVSTIQGHLGDGYTAVDCIKAAFPGGSITGAPKYRAMEIIDQLEMGKRNLYTGSIGYLGFDGNADFNIVIRTMILKDQKAYIGVGGGITWESEPEAEYNETLDKAAALFRSLYS